MKKAPAVTPFMNMYRKISNEKFEQEEPPVQFVPEKIVDCRGKGSEKQYLVKWKGYSSHDNSWEPGKNLDAKLLMDFEERGPFMSRKNINKR